METSQVYSANWSPVCAGVCALYIYIYGFRIYFQPMRRGYAPGPKPSKFQPTFVGHTLRYALNLCARVCAQACAKL